MKQLLLLFLLISTKAYNQDSSYVKRIDSFVVQIEKKALALKEHKFDTLTLKHSILIHFDSTEKKAYKIEEFHANETGEVRITYYYDGVDILKSTVFIKLKEGETKSFFIYFKDMDIESYKYLKNEKVVTPDEEDQHLMKTMMLRGLSAISNYQKSK